ADAGLSGDQLRDELRARAAASGETAAMRDPERDVFLAVSPARAPDGSSTGLAEAEAPAGPLEAAMRGPLRILAGVGLIVAARALAGIVEGVFAVDRERRLRYLNPQTSAMLGIDAGQAIGRFCGDVLTPRDADGGRPCEERCPIVHARFLGSARATEILNTDG